MEDERFLWRDSAARTATPTWKYEDSSPSVRDISELPAKVECSPNSEQNALCSELLQKVDSLAKKIHDLEINNLVVRSDDLQSTRLPESFHCDSEYVVVDSYSSDDHVQNSPNNLSSSEITHDTVYNDFSLGCNINKYSSYEAPVEFNDKIKISNSQLSCENFFDSTDARCKGFSDGTFTRNAYDSSSSAYDFNVKPACSHKHIYVKNSRYSNNNNPLTNVRAASSDLKSGIRRNSTNPFISCFDNDISFNEINLSNESNSMIKSKFLTLNCLVRTFLTVLMLDARVLAMEPLLAMLMILLHLLMISMLSLLVHISIYMLKTADIVIIIILLQMLGLHLLISNQVLEGIPPTLLFPVLTMTFLSTKLTSLMKAPFSITAIN